MENIPFVDRLESKITETSSLLLAGLDPCLEQFPEFVIGDSPAESLKQFYAIVLPALIRKVAAIKPNIAFFEQYGVSGLSVFEWLCKEARALGFLLIADVKRGDIGSTAMAYAKAYLPKDAPFESDAITVNPYLGFDTVDVFLEQAQKYQKGIYVLLRTSNSGAVALQGDLDNKDSPLYKVCTYLRERQGDLVGNCSLSGLGAVVGATFPQEARRLRELLPSNLFLVPGYGAQGGKAIDAVAGIAQANADLSKSACLINASRALLANFPDSVRDAESLTIEVARRAELFSEELKLAVISK